MRIVPVLMLLALAQAPQKGTIEVNVRDSATGLPIPGADLTFIFYQTPPPNVVTRATADDNGHAVFSDQPFGRYSISAQLDGYFSPPLPPGANAVLDAQNMKRSLDLRLTRGAAIDGQVLDWKGLPVPEASVSLLRKTYRDGRGLLVRQARGQTDDRGQYRLIGIAPGDYFLQAEVHPTRTAAQDKYVRISYYPNSLDTARAAPIKITGSSELAGMDIRIPNVPVYTVSGKVINATIGGRALPNGLIARAIASFFIGPRDTTSMEEPILVPNRAYSSQSPNSDETLFELTGFAPGSYYLYPISDGSLTAFTTKRTAIDVSDKNIEGLTITLQTPEDVKGRILVDGDSSMIRLDQIRVTPRWKESLPNLVSIRTTPTVAAQTGEFTLSAFPESRFTPILNGLPLDAYVSEIRQGAGSVYSDGVVTVGPGESDPIQITINPKGGAIQGTAQKADQQPFPNAGVVLVPSITRRGNSLLYKRVTADALGHFTMRGVAPGTYKLFAWPALPEGSAEENADFIAPFEGRGTAVNVEIGGTATAEVKVIQ